jgi:membrane-associated phospholipid phosphatase
MRAVLKGTLGAIGMIAMINGVSRAQSIDPPSVTDALPAESPFRLPPSMSLLFAPQPNGLPDTDALLARQPAGPPPTPRHTGLKALTRHFVTNFKYLPSKENLYWAAGGGGLALAAHPFDDDLNRSLVGNDTADTIFKAGAILGQLPTLLGSSSIVYAVGRLRDRPKVSHLGMDLIEALVMSEALTQTMKHTTRRERPDGSSRNSFPSGHAADTFAFATALERHLNWRYSIIGYAFASYVAISRLPANRHWLSDAVFGSTVGIIAGRTVTSHEADRPYPVALTIIPGGVAVMYTQNR